MLSLQTKYDQEEISISRLAAFHSSGNNAEIVSTDKIQAQFTLRLRQLFLVFQQYSTSRNTAFELLIRYNMTQVVLILV